MQTYYIVITSDDSDDLATMVNDKIQDNWVLIGGVSVCQREDCGMNKLVFAQAMTKHPEVVA